MTTRYCPTHARIWQPAGSETAYDGHERRLVQVYTPGHWRPFAPEALAWAQHLARQAGCAGQIMVEEGACDRCAATAARPQDQGDWPPRGSSSLFP